MASGNKVLEGIAKGLAIIGGAWLAVEILKAIAEKEIVWSCPNCKSDIQYGKNPCPACQTNLSWDFPDPSGSKKGKITLRASSF